MYPSARRVLRWAALVALLLTSVVVAALPGTTTASSVPGPPRIEIAPALVPPPPAELADARPTGAFPLTDAERRAARPDVPPAPPPSYFAKAQVIALYGHPGALVMGELGLHSPEDAAALAKRLAADYDALNGDRGVIAALHLIVDVAQYAPQRDGSYLLRMSFDQVQEYVDVARSEGMLLFLDLQIGWADPLQEVERLRPFLSEPFVHVALDPEFSTRARGRAPGTVIGSLDAAPINEVQRYLAEIVQAESLPPKILVVHQFLFEMLTSTDALAQLPEVELTVDMDGFGPQPEKIGGYERYAMASYAQRSAIKLFYRWDAPMLSEQQVMDLPKIPDYVIYQ